MSSPLPPLVPSSPHRNLATISILVFHGRSVNSRGCCLVDDSTVNTTPPEVYINALGFWSRGDELCGELRLKWRQICYVLAMMHVLASSTTEIMLSHITPQQCQVVGIYPRYVRDPQLSEHLPQLTHLMSTPQTSATKTWSCHSQRALTGECMTRNRCMFPSDWFSRTTH